MTTDSVRVDLRTGGVYLQGVRGAVRLPSESADPLRFVRVPFTADRTPRIPERQGNFPRVCITTDVYCIGDMLGTAVGVSVPHTHSVPHTLARAFPPLTPTRGCLLWMWRTVSLTLSPCACLCVSDCACSMRVWGSKVCRGAQRCRWSGASTCKRRRRRRSRRTQAVGHCWSGRRACCRRGGRCPSVANARARTRACAVGRSSESSWASLLLTQVCSPASSPLPPSPHPRTPLPHSVALLDPQTE